MVKSGTDPESYITEYTFVYEDEYVGAADGEQHLVTREGVGQQ